MTDELRKLRFGIRFSVVFVAILWVVKAIEYASSLDFAVLGIYPRTLYGTIGIFTGPLVHGDVFHLISNSIPLLVLIIGLFYFYRPVAKRVFVIVYLMTGVWVWFSARDAYHIGASGLVYGFISFLLFSGFIRRDIPSLALSFIIMVIYGGNMFYGIIPGDSGVSWESHLLGVIAGVFCAFYFSSFRKNTTPAEDPFVTSNYFTGKDLNRYDYLEKKNKTTFTYKINKDEDTF